MTDDLLDEATRLADDLDHLGAGTPDAAAPEAIGESADALRALVERVRDAEAGESEQSDEADHWVGQLERAEAERDAARGKLDKVRRLIPTENPELIEAGYGIDSRDVLAILDEE